MHNFRPAIAGYAFCYQLPSVYLVLTDSRPNNNASITIIKTSPYNIKALNETMERDGAIQVFSELENTYHV